MGSLNFNILSVYLIAPSPSKLQVGAVNGRTSVLKKHGVSFPGRHSKFIQKTYYHFKTALNNPNMLMSKFPVILEI